MAVGEFVDYRALPQPGAFEFQRSNGQPFVAMGPDAAALAQALERQRQASGGDQRLAMNGGGGAPSVQSQQGVGGASYGPPLPPPTRADVPASVVSETPGPNAATPPSPPTGAPAGAPAPARNPTMEYLFRPEVVPGRSHRQLVQQVPQGVAMPQSKVEEVEGGYPVNENYLEAQRDLSIDRRLLAQQSADRAMEAAKTGEEDARNEYARQGAKLAEQERLSTELQSRVNEDQQRYYQLRDEYRGARVDPRRIFRGEGGAIAAIGSAIAQGLGAFGAGQAHTRNFASDIIQAAIDRDISAQEREIAVKGDAANNALGDFVRSTGSLDQAKALLRTVENDWVSSQRAQTAAALKAPEIQAQAQQWDNDEQQRLLQFEEDYRRASLGKHSSRMAEAIAYPTAGGVRAPSEATIQKRAQTLHDVGGLESQEATTGKTRAETAKLLGASAGLGDEKDAYQYRQNRVAVDAGQKALQSYGSRIGAKFDPQTRSWVGDVGGVYSTGAATGSRRSKDIAADADTLAPMIARGLEGGSAPNKESIESLHGGMVSASGESMLAYLNALQRRMDEQQQALDTSVPANVTAASQARGAESKNIDTYQRTGAPPPLQPGATRPAPQYIR